MAAEEAHEDMIELMMKRLGVQRSVLVTRDLILTFSYVLTFALITGVVFWGACFTSAISVGIVLIMVAFDVIQVSLRQIIFNYTLPRKFMVMISAVLLILQVMLSYTLV